MSIENLHKKDLGLKTPHNYFTNSKHIIANNIKNNTTATLYKRKKTPIIWLSAAVIVLVFGLAFFNKLTTNTFAETDDILISSLFEADDKIDAFIDQYIEDEILTDELFLE